MRAPVKLLGGYSQTLPSNWKLYMENVKDSYHASLLHTFFTTFRLNRLSQKGGIVVSDRGGHHVSYSLAADTGGKEYEQAGMRAAQEGFGLEAPELLEAVDEFGDGIGLQILSVFPTFVLQQTRNSLAVRRLVPQGLDKTELVWTCFGFTSDDEDMTERRLRQANLIGPAGYISMEDGAAPGFVQRAVSTAPDLVSVVEMGGASVASEDNRVTEAAVRGFWKAYRGLHGDCDACPLDMTIELQLKVQDLNARYVQAIDDNKLEAWPDFFTEDGRYRVTTAENFERGLPLAMIYATSRAMLRDRVRSLRDANVYEAQRYRHVIGPPLVAPARAGPCRRRRASSWRASCIPARPRCSRPAATKTASCSTAARPASPRRS